RHTRFSRDWSSDVCSSDLVAGRSFAELSPDQLPACIAERAGFMAPFPVTVTKRHPYADRNSDSHGHFRPTSYTMPSYSAACVPRSEERRVGKEGGSWVVWE